MFNRGKHSREPAPVEVSKDDAEERLATILVSARVIEPYRVDAVRLNSAPGSLAQRLIADGAVSDLTMAQTLASHYKLGVADFRELVPEAAALATISAERARRFLALPIRLVGEDVASGDQGEITKAPIELAMVNPDHDIIAAVESLVGRSVVPLVATHRDLERALDKAYAATRDVGSQVVAFEARDALRREALDLAQASVNEEAPVVRVVQMIITQALRDRASDIHVEPSGERVRVRYRIDGALNDVLDLPGSIGPAIVSRVKILGGMNIVERRRPQDGQISTDIEGREVDIRVSTTAVVGGEKVVMRLLDKSRPLFKLEQLGMPADTADRFSRLIRSPYGMVICAGPTGGGKTTTLYAALGELNTPERNIMTIEDPVEYTFDSINQIQINEQAGITFAGGLKSILRQDPDVILVGEVRDADTARIAVQSALTGHFVLSSLHATEAVSALYRLLDMGIEPFLIASSVSAVMAQRLVRRSCTSCLERYSPTAEELAFLHSFGGTEPVGGFLHGVGCNFCAHTGYLERIGVYEFFVVTDEVREMIVDRVPHEEMRKLARTQGMRTLQEQAVRLIEQGTTTASEVMRSIYATGV